MSLKENILLQINELENHPSDSLDVFLTTCLHKVVTGQHLSMTDMQLLMGVILEGKCSDVLLSAIATALKIKGETTEEIAAAVSVMRAFANPVNTPYDVVDIVGTGGDGANLFNVSTASVFVMAAAGVKVAKHGSTGVSSRSGASDLLSTAGVNLAMSAEHIAQSIDETGIGFMFAPNHHPAMRHAKAVRGALKMRTFFNLLGPLSNPASAKRGVFGAYSADVAKSMCDVFFKLGATHIWAVHSEDGLDEISLAKPTQVFEVKDGLVSQFVISPSDFGWSFESLDDLKVNSSDESYVIITNVLQGKDDEISRKAKKIIALNAGAGLYVAGNVATYQDGVQKALDILHTDLAHQKMQEFIKFSQSV